MQGSLKGGPFSIPRCSSKDSPQGAGKAWYVPKGVQQSATEGRRKTTKDRGGWSAGFSFANTMLLRRSTHTTGPDDVLVVKACAIRQYARDRWSWQARQPLGSCMKSGCGRSGEYVTGLRGRPDYLRFHHLLRQVQLPPSWPVNLCDDRRVLGFCGITGRWAFVRCGCACPHLLSAPRELSFEGALVGRVHCNPR